MILVTNGKEVKSGERTMGFEMGRNDRDLNFFDTHFLFT